MVDDFQKIKKEHFKEQTRYEKERGKTLKQEEKTAKAKIAQSKVKPKPFIRGKLLKKPSVQLSQDLNARKAIMRGTGNLALVREVQPRPDVVPDTRSFFFNDSFVKEKERSRKWLLE